MDVWRITLAALRRWYILIPLLALTGWAAMVAGNGIHPEYEVQATAMLTPGPTVSQTPNPYGSIDDANQAVGIVLNNAESHAQIAAQGLSTDFTVTPETRSTIVRFMVRADDPQVAVATGAALIDLVGSELSDRQGEARVPRSSQYGVVVLAPPSVLNVVYDGKLRVQAIVGLLGASAALVVAVLFDDIVGLVKRRRRSGRARQGTDGAPSVGAGTDLDGRSAQSEVPTTDADRESAESPIEPDDQPGSKLSSTVRE